MRSTRFIAARPNRQHFASRLKQIALGGAKLADAKECVGAASTGAGAASTGVGMNIGLDFDNERRLVQP